MNLLFTPESERVLHELARSPQHKAKLKKVRKALGHLEADPRHPGLKSHKMHSVKGSDPSKPVWDSYVENNTPAAWRIYWQYGPDDHEITVLTIGPHPD